MPVSCFAAAAVDQNFDQQDQGAEFSQSELDCVHIEAKVAGANARGLVDSGANQSLLSTRYCKANGVVVTPAPQLVELADGKRMQVAGVCNVRIQIGQYKAVHKC
jgi:primase-polymerase (primpol)-like protein